MASLCTQIHASGPVSMIRQSLCSANLKHESEIRIFRNGTACQCETCLKMTRFRPSRNTCCGYLPRKVFVSLHYHVWSFSLQDYLGFLFPRIWRKKSLIQVCRNHSRWLPAVYDLIARRGILSYCIWIGQISDR